jgi:hypothetical protein
MHTEIHDVEELARHAAGERGLADAIVQGLDLRAHTPLLAGTAVGGAESWATERGAVGVFLTTMGHEGPDFYRRLGYRLLYVKRDAYRNRDFWYLKEFPDPVFRSVRA